MELARKQQNPAYVSMKKHEALWELDDNTIDSVYGGLAYYQKSVADYQSKVRELEGQGQTVDWTAVNQNLRQFADQTAQSFRQSLGADRFKQLQQSGVFNPLSEPPHYARPNGNIDQTNTVSMH